MDPQQIQWLLDSNEPWTRYRTLTDLLDRPPDDPDVQRSRSDMLTHPTVMDLISESATWPGYALKRHNDAKHPIFKFSTLADFGIQASDPGMNIGINAITVHQSAEGAFQTVVHIPKAFGGPGEDLWTWVLCDTPTLLYILLAMGLEHHPQVKNAEKHLAGIEDDNGWGCVASPELGKFKGPGRRSDPCPIATLFALKALSLVPEYKDSHGTRVGTEILLNHWEKKYDHKLFLFGTGTDFRKLKYPYVWYDILHVAEVLSRFPHIHDDKRFQEMVKTITDQADKNGLYTANSMYMAWKGWSFANKKDPSPWLNFLVLRILRRIDSG